MARKRLTREESKDPVAYRRWAAQFDGGPATIKIQMQDEPNVPGAWMCENTDIGPGSLQPGNVTFCEACFAKYEQGAALVHEDGHVLKPIANGRWVKAAAAGK
jgi:hypothetical protein